MHPAPRRAAVAPERPARKTRMTGSFRRPSRPRPPAGADRVCRIPGRVVAAPSWVMPGTAAENCAFLAGRVDEVGLLFFESAPCLAYGENDLPPGLAALPLSWHVHLPADLPMERPDEAAAICRALLDKAAFLGGAQAGRAGEGAPLLPRAVLHPPDATGGTGAEKLLDRFAARFAALGGDPARLLLENTRGNDLLRLTGVMREHGMAACLDLGHLLAYEQYALLRDEPLLERAAMLHLSAPGKGKEHASHLPLTALDKTGAKAARRLCRAVPGTAVLMMEMFRWGDIVESMPVLESWLLPGAVKSGILPRIS